LEKIIILISNTNDADVLEDESKSLKNRIKELDSVEDVKLESVPGSKEDMSLDVVVWGSIIVCTLELVTAVKDIIDIFKTKKSIENYTIKTEKGTLKLSDFPENDRIKALERFLDIH
jgi:hypothetical protein